MATATKPRYTNQTGVYFSDWMRNANFNKISVTDIDFVLYNYITNTVMLIEVKCKKRSPSFPQRQLFKLFSKVFKLAASKGLVNYKGFNLIQFENDTFENGKVYFNSKEVSEKQLKEILSI